MRSETAVSWLYLKEQILLGKKKNETLSDKFFMGDCILAADMLWGYCVLQRETGPYIKRGQRFRKVDQGTQRNTHRDVLKDVANEQKDLSEQQCFVVEKKLILLDSTVVSG